MKKNSEGFTIIELLVVVAIVGIMAALGVSALFRQRDVAVLREAQTQVGNALTRARALARRLNYDYQVTFVNSTQLKVEPSDPAAPVTLQEENFKLPAQTTMVFTSSKPTGLETTGVKYFAPFGRTDSKNFNIVINSVANGVSVGNTSISVIGVTGQVIKRGIEQ